MQVSSKVKDQCDFCSQATAAGQQEGGGDWNTASINSGHLDSAGAVAAAIYSGKCLQCNLKMDKDANLLLCRLWFKSGKGIMLMSGDGVMLMASKIIAEPL